MKRARYFNLAVLLFVNLLWAAQYPAYKVASDHMGVAALNFWTLLFASILLLPFLLRERRRHPGRPFVIREYLLMGLLGIVPPSVLLSWGINHSSASNAAILSLTIPVLMTVMALFMLGERLTVLRVVSLVLALAGTVLISRADFEGGSFSRRVLIGNLVIFLSGIGAAFYNTNSKKLLAHFSKLELLLYSYAVGASACAIISLASRERPLYDVTGYPTSAWLAILVLGAFSWGLAMVLWMWVLRRLDVTQASVSIYLLPVFGVILSAITVHDRITLAQGAGAFLVVAATFLTSEYETRRAAKARAH